MSRHNDPDDARDRFLDDVDDHAAGVDVGDVARDRIVRRSRRPQPKFKDVGRLDLVEVEPGEWTILLSDSSAPADPPGTYTTEGEALEAAKAWAHQRGLRTTWVSVTLQQVIR